MEKGDVGYLYIDNVLTECVYNMRLHDDCGYSYYIYYTVENNYYHSTRDIFLRIEDELIHYL